MPSRKGRKGHSLSKDLSGIGKAWTDGRAVGRGKVTVPLPSDSAEFVHCTNLKIALRLKNSICSSSSLSI